MFRFRFTYQSCVSVVRIPLCQQNMRHSCCFIDIRLINEQPGKANTVILFRHFIHLYCTTCSFKKIKHATMNEYLILLIIIKLTFHEITIYLLILFNTRRGSVSYHLFDIFKCTKYGTQSPILKILKILIYISRKVTESNLFI